MKFEFIESNSSNVGLVMSKGVSGNIVFFWDENEDAAEYILELYRCPFSIKAATFILPSKVYEHEISVSVYSDEKRRFINATEINSRAERQPSFIDGKLATTREWEEQDQQNYRNKIKRSKVEYTDFSEIKPVCVESIDRNRFYKSYNDLAKGSYIIVLKIMSRKGEEITRSYPYYFNIELDDVVGRLAPLIRSVGPNIVCN